jgi:hypothetical protein
VCGRLWRLMAQASATSRVARAVQGCVKRGSTYHPAQVLSRKLESPVSLPVYASHGAAVSGGSAAGETFMAAGDK